MSGIIDLSVDDEKRLIKLAQKGNRDVLNSLLIKYIPYIEKRALKYVQYGMEKEDMVQDGLVMLSDIIMRYAEDYKIEFRLYVCQSLDNLYLKTLANSNLISSKKLRKKISHIGGFISNVMYLEDIVVDYNLDKLTDGRMDPVFDSMMLGWVHDYIDILVKCGKLSEKEVKIIQLYYWDQKTFREIGDLMGRSKEAISSSHQKIIKKLVKCVNHLPRIKKESIGKKII